VSPVRRLFHYVVRYRSKFLIGLGCVLVTRAVMLAGPKVLGYAIDDLTRGVTGRQARRLRRAAARHRSARRRVSVSAAPCPDRGVAATIEYDMRNDFFAHLEKLPLAYFQSHRTGDLMSRATNDLNCRPHDDRPLDHVLGEHAADVCGGADADDLESMRGSPSWRSSRCRSCPSR